MVSRFHWGKRPRASWTHAAVAARLGKIDNETERADFESLDAVRLVSAKPRPGNYPGLCFVRRLASANRRSPKRLRSKEGIWSLSKRAAISPVTVENLNPWPEQGLAM